MNNIPYLNDDSDYPPQKLKGKAILLGESSVGKTCIINRLNDNTFTAITATTLGSAFIEKTYEINNIELTLNIWDTAGQEIYRSLNRIFYRDADVIIFVYDITKRKTFEEMKNYWYRQIEMSSEISNPGM
jgi:Ras-related protein Rab-18